MRLTPYKIIKTSGLAILLLVVPLLPLLPSIADKSVSATIRLPLLLPLQSNKDAVAPSVTATAVYIYDPQSNTVIYKKNSNQRLYPASTTKLMTALTALDIYSPDQILTVKSGNVIGSSAHLKLGDRLSVESLLNALLVNSGNDAALVLADNDSVDYSSFIARMNQKTQVLGLTDTHFTNSSGLIDPNHYTTAHDLTMIAKEAVQNSLIRKIVPQKYTLITDASGKISYPLESTNLLLGYDGVRGLKTGWTPESGECLVSLVTRDGHSIIVTVLDSKDRFTDSKKLIDWVYSNFSWQTI